MKLKTTFFKVSVMSSLLIIVLALAFPAQAQNVACYFEQGGAKFVGATISSRSCEIEMRTGTTLDIQSGATSTFANNPVFSGNPSFTGNPSFSGSPSFSGGTLTGTVAGNPTFSGIVDFDGAINANSTVDIDGNLTSGTGALTVADTINVTGAADFDSTLNVDGNTTLVGTVDATGDVTMATDLNVTAQDFFTVTIGVPITPTGVYMRLDIVAATLPAGGTSEIAAGSDGQLLILENIHATQPITIDGTGGTVECKANVALAPGDTLSLVYDSFGTAWRCLSTYDNS